MHLIFVCTANTCRSPLAWAAWQAFGAPLLEPLQAQDADSPLVVTVASAGIAAVPQQAAARHSVAVARGWGVELAAHRARRLNFEMAREADFMLTMTHNQMHGLRGRFGAGKVLALGQFAPTDFEAIGGGLDADLLRLWADDSGDILDPYGGSLEAYQACGAHIRAAVTGLAQAIAAGRFPPVAP